MKFFSILSFEGEYFLWPKPVKRALLPVIRLLYADSVWIIYIVIKLIQSKFDIFRVKNKGERYEYSKGRKPSNYKKSSIY